MNDIHTKKDVDLLVNTFYSKVLKDELLAPFFKYTNFEKHLPKMIDFWSFVLLDEAGYKTDVTQKHINMPLQKEHFDQWISVFHKTVDELFIGKKAEMAKQRAVLVGWTIQAKIENQ